MLELDENLEPPIIKLEDVTVDEKVQFFDELYSQVLCDLNHARDSNWWDDNFDDYISGKGFTILNVRDTKKLWAWFNKNINR